VSGGGTAASRSYSTAQAARIAGIREERVRALVRSGLCRPGRRGRRYAFSFQDLVVLRAAKGLLDSHVPPARVSRALAALAADLPGDRPLSGLRVCADGRSVVVRDGRSAWRPETGQIVFDFAIDDLRERARAEQSAVRETGADDSVVERARRAFERGVALEDDDPKAAADAYRRALAADPELVDAYVNLGRLAHEAGDAREASQLYHRALERSPDDPVIHFNLALALEDTRGVAPALLHYERAIALDPAFADAHFNLAGLYEQLGRPADALRHYHAYKKLTRG
jgi:tetratricopeptide (TPR) repeat protein